MKYTPKNPGMVALTTLMVVGSVGLLIVVFVMISNTDIVTQGLHETEYAETLAGAESCADEALARINNGTLTVGGNYSETIGTSPSEISCSADLVSGGGSLVIIQVTANQSSIYYSRLQVTVDTSTSPISISDFEEVASF